ncbi:MAG: response regulator [Gemmatimonadales bacterium]|nr:response regulator [Gemmatimonadales bacterium]
MPDHRPLRVLVADDDAAMVALLRALLGALGHEVAATAGTARDAVALADGCDVVFLDHQFPDAPGIGVIEAIRAAPGAPAVIVITAHGSEALAAEALRRGADDYLAKDAGLRELLPSVLERVRRDRALRAALEAAQAELVATERARAIAEMNVTLHHEINNPLMGASAEVELLLTEPGLAAGQREGLLAVRSALARIAEIVRRARDLEHAATTRYIGGQAMIDLHGGAAAGKAPMRGNAALWIADADLARIVGMLLGHAGFRVERCGDQAAFTRTTGSAATTLAVVQAVPGGDPLGGARLARVRGCRVVALVTGDGTAARAAGADLAIALPFDPARFAADIQVLVDS